MEQSESCRVTPGYPMIVPSEPCPIDMFDE